MQSAEDIKATTTQATGLAAELDKVGDISDRIKGSFKETLNAVSNFDTKLISTARNLGQSAGYAKSVENELGKAAVNVVKMGGSLEDVLATFKDVNAAIGKTTYLSQQFYENVEAIEKYGVKGETIISFAKFFDKVGGGMDAATQKQIELVNTAKAYGLNVGKFLGTVGEKLDIINKYGFPKGVSDLSSMVVKSQLLGDTLSVAQSFADKIMDSPEKAYEYAAQLQTLGGSFSQLGDGAQLLYMAQNDLKGLNDQVINATRGIATFNKETGQFEISANERLRLKGLKDLGIDANVVEETALKLAKQEKIMNEFNFSPKLFEGISKEQQQTLANYAQITAGGVIKIEGQDFNKLDNSQMQKILSNIQGSGSELKYKGEMKDGKPVTATESNIDSIQRNISATENVILANNQLTNAFSMATLNAGNFSTSLEGYTGVIVAAQTSVKTVLDKSVEGGTKILGDLKTSFSAGEKDTFLDRINEYTTAVSKDRFIKVEGNPTIDVKVTGLDAGVSDVVKTYVTNEIAKSIKVTASDSSGYSVGEGKK
jgi:hypothetical protein